MKPFTFIDLFAGIGGMRIAFEREGFRAVFSSEWDKFAARTYSANFGETPHGDIREIDERQIPDFDLLLAGFPCQPFSISGVSKKNSLGKPHGFQDTTQGTLFFDIARILKEKRPRSFLLENVKNLVSHDRGNTLRTILATLEKELGYHVAYRVINANRILPQNRERIYLVGFLDRDDADRFQFPESLPFHHQSGGIRHATAPRIADLLEKKVDPRYHLTDRLWTYLQEYREKHRKAGNGFGFGLVDLNGQTRTLSARYYKDGSEILIPVKGKNPRRLTPRECARLMGFPDDFQIVVSDTQAYRQFGNSVAVPVVQSIAQNMKQAMAEKGVPRTRGEEKAKKSSREKKNRRIA